MRNGQGMRSLLYYGDYLARSPRSMVDQIADQRSAILGSETLAKLYENIILTFVPVGDDDARISAICSQASSVGPGPSSF
jgi:hypothetical protein